MPLDDFAQVGVEFFLRGFDGGLVNRHKSIFDLRFAIVDFDLGFFTGLPMNTALATRRWSVPSDDPKMSLRQRSPSPLTPLPSDGRGEPQEREKQSRSLCHSHALWCGSGPWDSPGRLELGGSAIFFHRVLSGSRPL